MSIHSVEGDTLPLLSIFSIFIAVLLSLPLMASEGSPESPATVSTTRTIDGQERTITVSRATDAELREVRPSNYRAARLAGTIAGPIKRFGRFAGVTLPAESVPFYAAMYLHQLYFCDYKVTPNCLGDFFESLKDPLGHLGFAAFIAVSGATGRYLQRAMAATAEMQDLAQQVAGRGLGPGVRSRARSRLRLLGGRQVALNLMAHTLPMSFGMLASSIVEEIAHDPNLISCAQGIFLRRGQVRRSPEAQAALDRVCDQAYDHWVSARKVWSYGPLLAGMLAAQITSQVIQKTVGLAARRVVAGQVARRGNTILAKQIAVNGLLILLPGGAVGNGLRHSIHFSLKVFNLVLFFALNEEVYADVITRPWTRRQKGGELKGLVEDFNQRLRQLEGNNWDVASLYRDPPAICDDEYRAEQNRILREQARPLGHPSSYPEGYQHPEREVYQIERPDELCGPPISHLLEETRTMSLRWTEWRQFINERFLIGFQSWQNKLTQFLSLYDTSFAFYDDFLNSHLRFRERLREEPPPAADNVEELFEILSEGTEGRADELEAGVEPLPEISEEELLEQALLSSNLITNPYSTPTVFIQDDVQTTLQQARQLLEEFILEQRPFRRQPLLAEVLFLRREDRMISEDQQQALMDIPIIMSPTLTDYVTIRNHLLAAEQDFPLDRFFVEGSLELQQLGEAVGENREVLERQMRFKILSHAVQLMDSWMSYEVQNNRSGFAGDYERITNRETPEYLRACDSDEFGQLSGLPRDPQQVSRCTHVLVLGPDHILVKVRDTLHLPVFFPTGHLGRQSFELQLQLLDVDVNSIQHPRSLGFARTPGTIDYLFASMACGPESNDHDFLVGGQALNLGEHRQALERRYAARLATVDDEEQRLVLINEFKEELFQATQERIRQLGSHEIQSPFIEDNEGYHLKFFPPRIIDTPQRMSYIDPQHRVPQESYEHSRYGICGAPRSNFNVSFSQWIDHERGDRRYHGLPEIIEANLVQRLFEEKVIDPIEGGEVIRFYSWWEENLELPMFAAFYRFEQEFLRLLNEKFLPALDTLDTYGCRRNRRGDSPCDNLSRREGIYARGEALPEGLVPAIEAELHNLFRLSELAYRQLLSRDQSADLQTSITEWQAQKELVQNHFSEFLGRLEVASSEDVHQRRSQLEEVSRRLNQEISVLGQSMNMEINLQWHPDWVEDNFTRSLANAVRETGVIRIPEEHPDLYPVLRYTVFRMIELEEELRGLAQMLTFMPRNYSSQYQRQREIEEAADGI